MEIDSGLRLQGVQLYDRQLVRLSDMVSDNTSPAC